MSAMMAPAGIGLLSVRPTPPADMAARSADSIESEPTEGTSTQSALPLELEPCLHNSRRCKAKYGRSRKMNMTHVKLPSMVGKQCTAVFIHSFAIFYYDCLLKSCEGLLVQKVATVSANQPRKFPDLHL